MPESSLDTISNTNLSVKAEPVLAPPGAGIPFLHRMMGRYIFAGIVAKRCSWETCDQEFDRLGIKILERCKPLSAQQLRTRILVAPMLMLEDSSRYWSVAMTLEHLMIVGRGMGQIIEMLTSEKQVLSLPIADVAKVKPRPIETDEAAASTVREFTEFMQTHTAALNRAVVNRHSAATHIHPWFGKLTAWQWHWVMARHQAVHYGQIRAILANHKDSHHG